MLRKIFMTAMILALFSGTVYGGCAIGIINMGSTDNMFWSAGCDSVHRPGRYAGYDSFYLSETTSVQIDLTSSVDTYMFLLSGMGTTGSVLYYNDDGGEGTNSRLQVTLSAGWYTIESTTYQSAPTGLNTFHYVTLTELPSYVNIGSTYGSGNNNIVEFYGLNNGQCTRGYATCRGNWWVNPCNWQSSCSTGWEYNPADYYAVSSSYCNCN